MARREWIFCLLLALATLAVYAGVLSSLFIGLDDPRYIAQNPHVRAGLSLEGLGWAFTTFYKSNWHPLAWLSHMLDVELFGVDPAGHHATSLLLHILNSALLFAVLRGATRAALPSALVAALFALHPTHVESVAWIAERKDVLSTLFWFLTVGSYVGYARRGGAARYALVLSCLALGFMAKAMLVTLPLVLLLLDYWPLERLRPDRSAVRVMLEKLPMAAMSLAVAAVALRAQVHGQATEAVVDLTDRVANAVMSYGLYVWKTLWPTHLSVLVPHPNLPGGTPWAGWQVAATGAALLAASLATVLARRRYLVVGWAWFLVTLVPVIGLVQIGKQGMAYRYTYVSCIGLYVIAAWGGDEILRRGLARPEWHRLAFVAVSVVWLGALGLATSRQVAHWHDSVTLFEHSLAVAPGSATLHNNLGTVLRDRDRLDEAVEHFERAVEIDPDTLLWQRNLVNGLRRRSFALFAQGDFEAASSEFRKVLELQPDSARDRLWLGHAQYLLGDLDAAIVEYRGAVALAPSHALVHRSLGYALLQRGDVEEATAVLAEAVRLEPDDYLGQALLDESGGER